MRSAECGMRNAELHGESARGTTDVLTFRTPHSTFRILRVPGYLPSPPTFPPMPLRLAEHPEHDRPRERLWAVGPAALTGHELLAILLGTGCAGRDALVVAGEPLAVGGGSLPPLRSRPLAEVARVHAGGPGQGATPAA